MLIHFFGGIAQKRRYWVGDFGLETAVLGCTEAMRTYLEKYHLKKGEE